MIMPSTSGTATETVDRVRFEPGSFRDRNGRVFYRDGGIYRTVGSEALASWEMLRATRFFGEAVGAGTIVATERVDPVSAHLGDLGPWAAVLKHERIPFISYPYEWCFGMLQAAALLQLDMLAAALDEEMTLKDSTPFNIQWRGTTPVFVDIPSFERYRAGEPWGGYRQFCKLFLYPLLLQAYKDVPFHAWLRGSIDGIDPGVINNLMSLRDLLRPGVLLHVTLQARAESRYAPGAVDVRQNLQRAGFSRAMIVNNVSRLRKLVAGLSWAAAGSTWSDYGTSHSYSDADRERKLEFVRTVAAARQWALAWDLGCNEGTFSRIVAEHADTVVAVDADHLTLERLYRTLSESSQRTILPLYMNLSDPSPDLGWRGLERKAMTSRARPELILCLALIHHLVIAANVPLHEVLDYFAAIGGVLIIEFVDKSDPMVQRLLQNKVDQYGEYTRPEFERLLAERYDIVRSEALPSGTRTLYHARPKAGTLGA